MFERKKKKLQAEKANITPIDTGMVWCKNCQFEKNCASKNYAESKGMFMTGCHNGLNM